MRTFLFFRVKVLRNSISFKKMFAVACYFYIFKKKSNTACKFLIPSPHLRMKEEVCCKAQLELIYCKWAAGEAKDD